MSAHESKSTSLAVLDLLLEPGDIAVVLIGEASVFFSDVFEFLVELVDEFVNGLEQILESTAGGEVDFSVVENVVGPAGLLDFGKDFLLVDSPDVAGHLNGEDPDAEAG